MQPVLHNAQGELVEPPPQLNKRSSEFYTFVQKLGVRVNMKEDTQMSQRDGMQGYSHEGSVPSDRVRRFELSEMRKGSVIEMPDELQAQVHDHGGFLQLPDGTVPVHETISNDN